MMHPKSRKQAAHVASAQRRSAKRDQHKAIEAHARALRLERKYKRPMSTYAKSKQVKRAPVRMPKLVKQARERMIERARILAFPSFVRRKAAGE